MILLMLHATLSACLIDPFYHLFYGRCQQISDTGMVEVARRCCGLASVDLTRTALHFKVGDVTLLVRAAAHAFARHQIPRAHGEESSISLLEHVELLREDPRPQTPDQPLACSV